MFDDNARVQSIEQICRLKTPNKKCPILSTVSVGRKIKKVILKTFISFLTLLILNVLIRSVELKKNMDCLKNNLVSKCSAMSQKAAIFDDVVKSLRANLMTQRFFCNKVDLNLSMLHRSVKATANCKPEFFVEAEKCAEPFRKTYTEELTKKSERVCT